MILDIVDDLAGLLGVELTPEIANALYVALVTDTDAGGNLKHLVDLVGLVAHQQVDHAKLRAENPGEDHHHRHFRKSPGHHQQRGIRVDRIPEMPDAEVLVDLVGSLVGGSVTHMFSRPREGAQFHPAGLIFSTLGAILVLFVCYKLKIRLP